MGTTISLSPLFPSLAWSKATVAGIKATTLRWRERAEKPEDLDSDILKLLKCCQPLPAQLLKEELLVSKWNHSCLGFSYV